MPSPAPGDPTNNNLHSPQRKLSVIPEVPGFSRPPSLAELAAVKQKSGSGGGKPGDPSFDIIVSEAKDVNTSGGMMRANVGFNPSALPRGLTPYDRLQQYSLESSVVTEGHYDASFETEDQAASFDVDPHNYIYVDDHPTILSNGHFKMCPAEMKMLGMNHSNKENLKGVSNAKQISGNRESGKANGQNGMEHPVSSSGVVTTNNSLTTLPNDKQPSPNEVKKGIKCF